jgi:tetratricopeptide (TPR) repeat protein/tRNA A-37 threonylcarbamoyl transferase component Bud32
MHDAKFTEQAKMSDPALDLDSFGFNQDADGWLAHFRRACRESNAPIGMLGDFEILEEVGRGGQGIVYRARQRGMDREVAVKRLICGAIASQEARQRFELEIKSISRLQHDHIVTVFARDVIDGQPIVAMEWVDGMPITRWAGDAGNGQRRTPHEIIHAFLRVTDAVHHAHQRGVLHRDIKPSNILVDADNRPYLLDFGLAKGLHPSEGSSDADGTRQFVGTPRYCAPEQIAGDTDQLDIRTDVYAVGVVMFEALTGCLPYTVGDSLVDALQVITREPPARPSTVRSELDRDIDAILLKALHKDKDQRYPSVEAFAADMQRYLDHEPVLAHPPSRLYALRKLIIRNRLAVGVAAAVFVLTMVFAIVAGILADSAVRAQHKEHEARVVAERVGNFLGEVLSSARPSRGGADMKMLEALDEAAERAQTELRDQPRVAAEVLYRIGFTYRALWRFADALPHLEEALRLNLDFHDGDHDSVVRCMVALGTVHTSLRNAEAVDLQRSAMDMRIRLFGPNSLEVAESMTKLAYALHQGLEEPQWDEAEGLFTEALAIYGRLVGDTHRDLASCLHNYGWMRYRQSRFEEAMHLYGQAMDVLRRIGDLEDPYYAECMHGYSALLVRFQEFGQSLELLEEAIPLIRRIYGPGAVQGLLLRRAVSYQGVDDCASAHTAFVVAFLGALDLARDRLAERLPSVAQMRLDLVLAGQDGPLPVAQLVAIMNVLPESGRTDLQRTLNRYIEYLQVCGSPQAAEEAAAAMQSAGAPD